MVLRISIDGNELFSQTMCVKRYTTHETMAHWTEQKMNAGFKWREVFQYFYSKQIQFDRVLKVVSLRFESSLL